jgi:hypothetical protein
MATALTTVDLFVASILRSYVAANELILQSSRSALHPDLPRAEIGTEPHQKTHFIIGNTSGKPPVAIPLALFQSPVRNYLSSLHLDLPCYTMSGSRFFKRLKLTGATVLHSFAPTRWQRLFYTCNLYHIAVEIDAGQTRVQFHAATAEEASCLDENRKRLPKRLAWKFRLTPEQEQQLRLLPQTTAKPIYWHSGLMRVWRWLSGNSNQT